MEKPANWSSPGQDGGKMCPRGIFGCEFWFFCSQGLWSWTMNQIEPQHFYQKNEKHLIETLNSQVVLRIR